MSKQVTFEVVAKIINEFSSQQGIFKASELIKKRNVKNISHVMLAMANLGLIKSTVGKGSKWTGPLKPSPIIASQVMSEIERVRKVELKRAQDRYYANKGHGPLELEPQNETERTYVLNYTHEKPTTEEMIEQLKKEGLTIQRTEEVERGFKILGIKVTWTQRKTTTL